MAVSYEKLLAKSPKQAIAYAAAITPNPSNGRLIVVGELTGNITVNNPPVGHVPTLGDRVTFYFTSNATGRQITFGSAYRAGTVPASSAAQRARIAFQWDGAAWVAIAPLVWLTA